MCVGCAMSAMAGASGLRAVLQSRRWSFLTPQRLRRATVGAFCAALLVSTVGLGGSSAPSHHRPAGQPTARAPSR